MKSKMSSGNLNKLSNLLTLNNSSKRVALSLSDMKKVRGGGVSGDCGEANGWAHIIMIPK